MRLQGGLRSPTLDVHRDDFWREFRSNRCAARGRDFAFRAHGRSAAGLMR